MVTPPQAQPAAVHKPRVLEVTVAILVHEDDNTETAAAATAYVLEDHFPELQGAEVVIDSNGTIWDRVLEQQVDKCPSAAQVDIEPGSDIDESELRCWVDDIRVRY